MKSINSEKSNGNLVILVLLSLFIILFIASTGIYIYCSVIIPRRDAAVIKEEIIKLYAPIEIDEGKSGVSLTLADEPSEEMRKTAYEYFMHNYGLEIVFIENGDDLFVEFFKDNSKLKQLGTIRLHRNKKSELQQQDFSIEKSISPTGESIAPTGESIASTGESIATNEKSVSQSGKSVSQNVKSFSSNGKSIFLTWKSIFPNRKPVSPSEKSIAPKEKSVSGNEDKTTRAKIAIVIDDAGYNYQSADIFYKSRLPLTFALIPDLPNSKEHYEKICDAGMNLILHIPMEPGKGVEFVEKQAILVSMTTEEITQRLELFFNHYPKAAGMNNHMGSRAVKDYHVMDTVLNFAKERGIFWLDSKTTPASVSRKVATEKKLAYLERDIFLDNENTEEYAKQAMEQLIKIAKKRGYAIGIGHVQSDKLYPVLEEYKEKQNELEIEFVPLVDLIL